MIYGRYLMSQNHMSQSPVLGVRVCKQYIWQGYTIRLRCGNVSFPEFNGFSHASRIEIWIRAKNVVPL